MGFSSAREAGEKSPVKLARKKIANPQGHVFMTFSFACDRLWREYEFAAFVWLFSFRLKPAAVGAQY